MKELLEAGVHFGHQTKRWNPKMKEFIFGERNGIYIIDLQKTLKMFKEASKFVQELAADGKIVLFVGTKRQAQDAIAEEATKCGGYSSLSNYVHDLGWMHPFYAQLRRALSTRQYASEHERQLIALNLERARALPAGKQRYILVNAAQQKLFMYDKGELADSMVVVVGKPKYPTPMMTAY